MSCGLGAELLANSPVWTLPFRPVVRFAPAREDARVRKQASLALVSAPLPEIPQQEFQGEVRSYASSKVCFSRNVSGSCAVCSLRDVRAELHSVKTCGDPVLRGQRGSHKNHGAALRNDPPAIPGLRRGCL